MCSARQEEQMVKISYKVWHEDGAWCVYRKEQASKPFSRLYLLVGEYPTKEEAKRARKLLSDHA